MYRHIPRYLFVYNSLKNQIENLEYNVGDHLPSEPELEKLFAVSRTTVRKAVEMLANQGFVSVQQGKGTSVLDHKATQRLQYVTSFSETLIEQGFQVNHKVLSVLRITANARMCSMFQIHEGSLLVQIDRIAYADQKPIGIMRNYILPDLVPDIEKKVHKIGSLYHFLEDEYNLFIDSATDNITARKADGSDAKLLEIEQGEPLLIVRRISYRNDQAIEASNLKIRAEKYEYTVHTKKRPLRNLENRV